MDLKDKIKNSGIEIVKNKLNNLKNRLEKQKRPEKQSKLKNSIEGALSTALRWSGRAGNFKSKPKKFNLSPFEFEPYIDQRDRNNLEKSYLSFF